MKAAPAHPPRLRSKQHRYVAERPGRYNARYMKSIPGRDAHPKGGDRIRFCLTRCKVLVYLYKNAQGGIRGGVRRRGAPVRGSRMGFGDSTGKGAAFAQFV